MQAYHKKIHKSFSCKDVIKSFIKLNRWRLKDRLQQKHLDRYHLIFSSIDFNALLIIVEPDLFVHIRILVFFDFI